MPEGPEVESARLTVEKYCLGSKVCDIVREEQGGGPRDGQVDDRVCLVNIKQAKSLMQQSVDQVNRKGKYFWINFSGGSSLLFHLGMTGSIVFGNRKVPGFKAFKVSTSWPPKFTKFMMSFSNGEKLAFSDPRRLGRVQFVKDPIHHPPVSKLAPDPLLDGISKEAFLEILAKSTAPIKSALLDQEKLCCGIGNWVADEVLYQSNIHPETPCSTVATCTTTTYKLVDTISEVLQRAVLAKANDTEFPSHWLFHRRWGKGRGSKEKYTIDGKPISFLTIGGRTSAVVLSCQKKLTATVPMRKKRNAGRNLPIAKKTCSDNDVLVKKQNKMEKIQQLNIDELESSPKASLRANMESVVMTRARKRSQEAIPEETQMKVKKSKKKK